MPGWWRQCRHEQMGQVRWCVAVRQRLASSSGTPPLGWHGAYRRGVVSYYHYYHPAVRRCNFSGIYRPEEQTCLRRPNVGRALLQSTVVAAVLH